MIRMFDYECPSHGVFEGMIVGGAVAESMECPHEIFEADKHGNGTYKPCGNVSIRVWRKAPGVNPGGVHAVEIGGRTYRREDMEAFLDQPATPKTTPFFKKEGFREDFLERLSRNTQRELNGELPKQELTETQAKEIEKATANVTVDPALANASTNQFVETFRKTELKE
jgi:hypothetical protein